MAKQVRPQKLDPKDKTIFAHFQVPYKAKGIMVSIHIGYDGACVRSLEGLKSFTYTLSRERDVFYGARQAGTGVRNFNNLIKAYNDWDKKDFAGLWNSKHRFDYWSVS